jgi:hypothetical protein
MCIFIEWCMGVKTSVGVNDSLLGLCHVPSRCVSLCRFILSKCHHVQHVYKWTIGTEGSMGRDIHDFCLWCKQK